MSNYKEQAVKFLRSCGARMSITYDHYGPHFAGETECRDIYRVRIDRNGRSFSFRFGQSVNSSMKGERPNAYDVLACLTKYEPEGDVWEFANEYGYEVCDRESWEKVNRIFKAVQREYAGVCRVFGDVLEELCEIQ